MPPAFTKKDVDSTVERNILTAAILSDEFLAQFAPMYQPVYMKNTYARVILSWTLDYFERFSEAPKHTIKDIYDVEKSNLDDADADIIKAYLTNLNKQYLAEQPSPNHEYILEQTKKYFQHREISVRVETAQKYLLLGNDEKAEAELNGMRKVLSGISGWSNPFDEKSIHEVFDDRSAGVFKFTGALGEMIGSLERGWFVAILGSFKKGKSYYLQEAAIQAATSGLKAVFISLEMKQKNIHERMLRRLTSFGAEGTTHHPVPVFDCKKNQDGTCTNSKRVNKTILTHNGILPEFENSNKKYKVCTACREDAKDEYSETTWFELMHKKEFTTKHVIKGVKAAKKQFGDNLRVKCYPRFTASLTDIKRDMDRLEREEGFIPDVIVVDYADILKPDGNTSSEARHSLDDIWKKLAGLASERACIVFTASQSTRGAIYKKSSSQTDLAEHIGKLAHVDIFLTLNQTGAEKHQGVMRMGMIAHRHKEFHEDIQAKMLQCPTIGQSHLDSLLVKAPEE